MSQLATVGPEFSICSVCGEACEPWKERCWNEGSQLVHERCKDWSSTAFPYRWELDRLRRWSRALRRVQRSVDGAGVWLSRLERSWPDDAHSRLETWADLRSRLRDELRRAADELGKG